MEYSTRIYQVYLKYIAPEDIVVYSIDEVFMDVTDYLNTYKLSAHDLAMKIILDVLETTGITATAGIGTNLFPLQSGNGHCGEAHPRRQKRRPHCRAG